jgi:hypothetical protein
MNTFVESMMEDENVALLEEFKTAMVGQKRTSMSKGVVYLLPRLPNVVYKGPFAWPQKAEMISLTLFRAALFGHVWSGGCRVVSPKVVQFGRTGQVYFRMKNVAPTSSLPSDLKWVGTKQVILGFDEERVVIDKKSQGIMELSTYLDQPAAFQQDDVLRDALIHFIHRYISSPIVGDAAVRNVLVNVSSLYHIAYGIDFEENRTGGAEQREAEEKGDLFHMICGGKKWNRKYMDILMAALRRKYWLILDHLEKDISKNWDAVQRLVEKHKLTEIVSIPSMKSRFKAVNDWLRYIPNLVERAPEPKKRKSRNDNDDDDNDNDVEEGDEAKSAKLNV